MSTEIPNGYNAKVNLSSDVFKVVIEQEDGQPSVILIFDTQEHAESVAAALNGELHLRLN